MSDAPKPSANLVNIDLNAKWLEKLIDVISRGVGALSARFVAKRIVDGEVYQVKELAAAVAEANALDVRAEYVDGRLTITPREEVEKPEDDPALRAAEYIVRRDTNRLASTEVAATFAGEELRRRVEAGETISEDPVDEAWAARYFDAVGNVRDEDALRIWGQVLAGEVAQPGSFSLRSINILTSLSPTDAALVQKALQNSFFINPPQQAGHSSGGNFGFFFNEENAPDGSALKILNHYQCQVLSSIGIIGPATSSLTP